MNDISITLNATGRKDAIVGDVLWHCIQGVRILLTAADHIALKAKIDKCYSNESSRLIEFTAADGTNLVLVSDALVFGLHISEKAISQPIPSQSAPEHLSTSASFSDGLN
jgi:hypothetical protein